MALGEAWMLKLDRLLRNLGVWALLRFILDEDESSTSLVSSRTSDLNVAVEVTVPTEIFEMVEAMEAVESILGRVWLL